MLHTHAQWWVSRLLDVPIASADWTHYGGVFIYNKGDYLRPHVDAGRHPKTKHVKVATAILYLTKAELMFWHGEPGYYQKPIVYQDFSESYIIEPGSLVLFANTDDAWHSVPQVSYGPRVCITCSYLAPDDFKDHRFSNTRTRAYFARMEWESTGLDDLREQRASEEHHEGVYRVES